MTAPKLIAWCSLTVLIALYVVGAVSHGSLRHEVQTLPLWLPIVAGFRQQRIAKWMAMPCLIFWLAIMVLIWLFLLGWARIVSGTFSPVEIAMTITIGVACVAGLAAGVTWRSEVRVAPAVLTFVLVAAFQLLAFRVSLIPYIARQ